MSFLPYYPYPAMRHICCLCSDVLHITAFEYGGAAASRKAVGANGDAFRAPHNRHVGLDFI